LGEVHYLLADNYLEIARAAPTQSERTSQLERARAHHKTADGLFAGGPAPFVLQWQTEQLRSQPDSTGGSNWKNFAQWLKTTKLDQAASTNWLDQRLLAMECYQQGDYRTALKLLEEGLKHHATDYPGWLVLGNCYAQAKNLEKADVCYLVCLTLRPDSSDTYLSRALARIDQKAFKDALADLNRCLELRPGDPYFFANRGVCHFNLGDMKSAEADLSQAIELGATETRLYFFRSMVRKALGDGPGAETDLATGLKLTPSDTDSWLSRGFYLVETDPQQALDNFQNAIRLSPRSATAWENCAALYAGKLNDLTKAIECMDELLRIEPENAKHWASRGALHARNNQPDKAMADAADALKLSTSPETLYRVGSLYARLSEKHPEHTAKAINLIRAAASKDPRFVLRYLKNPAGQLADEDLKPIFEIPEFKEFYDRFVWLMTPPSPK
jgi:tetratricopeptide (TPR) repeat protein